MCALNRRQDSLVFEQAATAYLVVGFQDRQPSHIRASDYILQQISKVSFRCL